RRHAERAVAADRERGRRTVAVEQCFARVVLAVEQQLVGVVRRTTSDDDRFAAARGVERLADGDRLAAWAQRGEAFGVEAPEQGEAVGLGDRDDRERERRAVGVAQGTAQRKRAERQ